MKILCRDCRVRWGSYYYRFSAIWLCLSCITYREKHNGESEHVRAGGDSIVQPKAGP